MINYLLDANFFITLSQTYYGFDMIPEFWMLLKYQAEQDCVKTPLEIWNEIEGA